MKRHTRRILRWSALAVVSAALVLSGSCRPSEDAVSDDVVATIGDYTITKAELRERLAQEIRPQRDGSNLPQSPVTPEAVLLKMVGEKAIVLEGRQAGYLEDEQLRSSVDRYRIRRLVEPFVTDYVMENVPILETEIEAHLAADPNLTREQAEMKVRSEKAPPVLNALYDELLKKHDFEKVRENFAAASQIHQRLLTRPQAPRGRGVFWVMNKQIREELTDQEKQIVLVRYTGGEITLYEWFDALGQIAPPGRPKDLSTVAGVERFLDRAMRPFVWEAEALAQGYDQNEEFLQQVRDREDMSVLSFARRDKYKELVEATDEEIKAYYDAHPEAFAQPAGLKVQQIWCADLAAAEAARQMLTEGASFEAANEAHGLRDGVTAHSVYPGSEGVFWDDLWQAEPNEVTGPVKGFYETGIKWRLVKVLEKTPAEMRPYSDSVKNQAQSALMSQRREDLMAGYAAELLKKYPHKIYTDRIADIDPLEVAPPEVQDE